MAHVRFTFIGGSRNGSVHTFEESARVLVGRDPDCELRPIDEGVSRHHCLIELDPPTAEIRDLGSLNGTIVNGTKLGGRSSDEPTTGRASDPIELHDGDRIAIGKASMVCHIAGAPTAIVLGADPADAELDAAAALIVGYEPTRMLNRGGQGAIYHVLRKRDGADFVVKMLLSNLARDPRAQAMFEREISLMQKLVHPNIVTVREEGRAGRFRYFVMDYCSGGSVDDLVVANRGKLPIGESTRIVTQALAGLAHAHAHGVVHRDIKPGNILLSTAGGIARVTDFGLAKSFHWAGDSGITSSGNLAGTPDFMPRDQLLQYKHVGPTCDVWAMGATLYFMITGKTARDDKPAKDPAAAILINEIVPIRKRAPEIDERVANVIDRSLADDPEDRFADAGAMREALLAVV